MCVGFLLNVSLSDFYLPPLVGGLACEMCSPLLSLLPPFRAIIELKRSFKTEFRGSVLGQWNLYKSVFRKYLFTLM